MEVAQLVHDTRQGQRQAFGELVERFQNAGYAMALSRVHDPTDAEDVLQDSFVAAYCRLGQLREPAAFAGWFRSIVVSQCNTWLRQRNLEQQHSVNGADMRGRQDPTVPGDQASRVVKRRLWEQVHALAEPYRSAALLHYLSGFSHAEIAAFLQVPLSTVNGRLQQSRLRLRDALDPDELKEIEMSKVNVVEEVADALYQVVSEPLQEEVELGDRQSVVLFCGVSTDLQVEPSEGKTLTIEGSRVSMGLSPETARESALRTQLEVDEVADYAESGPHPGELFAGTNRVDDLPETHTCSTADHWTGYLGGGGYGVGNLTPGSAFPELRDRFQPFPEEVAGALRDVVRISLVQDEAQALTLPPDAYQPRLQKVFRPNANTKKWLHGPVGYAALTVSVPRGKHLTVIHADEVEVRNLQASVSLMQCKSVKVEDVAGDVTLLDSPIETAHRIRGKLSQRWYSSGGMNWLDDELVARRGRQFDCSIEDVEGEIDIDVGRANIELARFKGTARVANRHGTIRLHVGEPLAGSRYHLETVCGPVRLFLHEDVIPELRFGVITLCGAIEYQALRDERDKGVANSTQLGALSSIPPRGGSWNDVLDAELLVKTESGDVVLEKVK